MNPPLTPEAKQSCEARLNEIGKAEISALTAFAEIRLMRLNRSSCEGEDLVQSAILAVVRGLESDQVGRRPRPEDIVDKDAFVLYLQGVILSLLQCMTKSREIKAYHKHHQILDEHGADENERGVILASPTQDVAAQAEWDDLQEVLFSRLRQRAPSRLHRTIDAWDQVFQDSDRIPADTFRKYVVELRGLAREVLQEIGGVD